MSQKPVEFKKIAMFTDIHFGRRGNSKIHNQDCLDYVNWFCTQVKNGNYSHVAFLGDWFESRSAINIETLEYSYMALQQLNNLGMPVYFCVGNHDLHRRTTRDVHSVRMFNEMSNFIVIDKPTIVDSIMFSPFLFEEEYPKLIEYNDLWAWCGHFEFKNFILTGHTRVAEHGPDHRVFSGPKRIFSGHFHKRQEQDNIIYIGNAFPMDFGDAGDYDRGMCTFYVNENKVTFTNWNDCPKYYKTTLSAVIEEKWHPLPKMKVKCIIDGEVSYQDAQDLRNAMMEGYNLRDFSLEEDRAVKQGLLEGDNCKVEETLMEFDSIDGLVIKHLETIKDEKKSIIDGMMLVEIYKSLSIEVSEGDQT
jgi:DNA repair exonuclease SbcCD nuclease subunit